MNLLVFKLVMYLIRNEWGYNLRISWKKMTILPVGVCVCVNHGFNEKFSLVFPYQWILGAAKIRGLVHPSFFPFCAILHWGELRHSSFYSGFSWIFTRFLGLWTSGVDETEAGLELLRCLCAALVFGHGLGSLATERNAHGLYKWWCWGDIKYWCSINVYDIW